MAKVMKCPECGGTVFAFWEAATVFRAPIGDDGMVNHDSAEIWDFAGRSDPWLCCVERGCTWTNGLVKWGNGYERVEPLRHEDD